MSTFTILYFAAASSYTGRSSDSLPAPLAASKLFPLLEQKYPGITKKVLDSCLVTVNLEYVDIPGASGASTPEEEDVVIEAGSEVAIIPPVSSG
ncbi:molybdopterin synthase small subunit CnxG [Peziza echinospora]|nr:molybdopterin synthase small subunit CnxG [Peziza echinospora]